MSLLGLIGAHRVGKTTLARAYAERRKMEFVETSVSAIFKELGFDPAVTYDFSTRLTIQEEILMRLERVYSKCNKMTFAITDRTPLDMLAYTMAEAIGDSVSERDQERFRKYAQNCIDVTNRRFSIVCLVQPGIPVIAAEGKAALNEAYIEHLNSLILGLSVDERVKTSHFYIPRHMTDMDDRIVALDFTIGLVKKRAIEDCSDAVMH
jgi:hypothetical protein